MGAGSISSSINFPLISDGNRRKVTCCQIKSVLSQLEEIMKLAISIVTPISLGPSCTAPADNYDTLAADSFASVRFETFTRLLRPRKSPVLLTSKSAGFSEWECQDPFERGGK